ncbi:glycerophosphodiester phosphodiesterase [Bacillus sp. UMB0893]|uniref:glycerophosphodiester phosphodiesterase n=1 Tax=Bacillus sp. UMB0893 TaxID=2066053 RepID=UPI000C789D83|nr:glycerophosphodiester phosphodiesterase family protein [Bacillus sp. UMB0893]PLR66151.1 hypothetical protein CYJ36_18730 [Bacillus sp. UMB0893]QNG58337.1 hypothetical protein H4O14_10695 [Bacillus sp. PAMC26568]
MILLKYFILLVIFFSYLFYCEQAADPPATPHTQLLIAHRGLSSYAPENTISSFDLAAAEGFDLIELDVQMSKDKQLVVIHDTSLKRTANFDEKVANLTLDELQTLDVGIWFDESFAGETIPTLNEVFTKYKDHHLLIDIKRPSLYPGIEQVLADNILKSYKPQEYSLLSIQSADLTSIRILQTLLPHIKKGLVVSSHIPYHQINALGSEIDFLTLHKRTLTIFVYQQAKRANLTLYIWGIQNKYDYKNVKRLAVDGVVINKTYD